MQMVARNHDVWLLTSERCREGMEGAVKSGAVPGNVKVFYAGPSFKKPKNAMRAKLSEWPYYRRFLADSWPVAERLHSEVGFDLVHHVTFATWRVGVPYWKLGIPLVFGPIGGGEQFDLRFLPYLSLPSAAFELLRVVSNWRSARDQNVIDTVHHSSVVLVSTPETGQITKKMAGPGTKFVELSVTSFPEKMLQSFPEPLPNRYEGPLRLFGAGTLEGRKGVLLVLHAMKRISNLGRNISYRFCMGGPEAEFLRGKVQRMGLQNSVQLTESPPRQEYESLVRKAHIYLLPSLRDNSPVSLLEAMLNGCAPIVAGCGGPNLIVTEDCGIRIPLSRPDAFIEKMVEVILKLDDDRKLLETLGHNAVRRVQMAYSETSYAKTLEQTYRMAMGQKGHSLKENLT